MRLKYIGSCIICLIITLCTQAQSWQWGIRGGGMVDNNIGQETVVDMATDAHGNVYALSKVNGANGSITVGNITKSTIGGTSDMLVTSYNCNGQLRWIKVIGTNSSNDTPNAISVDGTNNVYVSGFMPPLSTTLYFDTDTIQSNHTKNFFIISYDSSGVYRWLKQPGSDTITDLIRQDRLKRYSDMVGSPSGGVYNMSYMPKGLLAGGDGVVVPQDGMYITEYNVNGNIVSLTALDMQVNPQATNFLNIRMLRMPSGKFVISGILTATLPSVNYNFSVGGNIVDHPIFITCLGTNGNMLWLRKGQDVSSTNSNSYLSGFHYRPFFDKVKNHILLAGRTYPQLSFLGYTFNNQLGAASIPFACSLDTLGNLIWITNASSNGTSTAKGISSTFQNVHVTGDYPGTLQWGSKVLINEANRGYDVFSATLDANTGNAITLDSLDSDFGYNDRATAIVSDNKGNIYIAGEMGNQLFVGNADTLQSSGGTSDFFIAKFGTSNCSNTIVPITLKAFTANLKQQQVQCNWQSEQEINSSHFIVQRSVNQINYSNIATIPTKGSGNQYNYTDFLSKELQQVTKTFYYRLAMVDKDGSVQYSKVAAVNLTQQQHIQVYPNPVKDQLTLVFPKTQESLQVVQLYNLQGIMVLQTYLNAHTQILTVPAVKKLTKGTYLVKVEGHTTVVVVKE